MRDILAASSHLYKRVGPSVHNPFFGIREIAYFRHEQWIQSGMETHACTNTHTHALTYTRTYTHKRAAEINEWAEDSETLTRTHTHME